MSTRVNLYEVGVSQKRAKLFKHLNPSAPQEVYGFTQHSEDANRLYLHCRLKRADGSGKCRAKAFFLKSDPFSITITFSHSCKPRQILDEKTARIALKKMEAAQKKRTTKHRAAKKGMVIKREQRRPRLNECRQTGMDRKQATSLESSPITRIESPKRLEVPVRRRSSTNATDGTLSPRKPELNHESLFEPCDEGPAPVFQVYHDSPSVHPPVKKMELIPPWTRAKARSEEIAKSTFLFKSKLPGTGWESSYSELLRLQDLLESPSFERHLEVFNVSEEVGRGVMVTRRYVPNELIAEYRGHLMSKREGERAEMECDDHRRCYFFYFKAECRSYCIDATEENGSKARLINHSYLKPNAKTMLIMIANRPRLLIVAAKSIPPYQEVRYDYGESRPEVLRRLKWMRNS